MPLGTMANSMRADDWASLSEAVVPMYTDEQNIKHQEEIVMNSASDTNHTVRYRHPIRNQILLGSKTGFQKPGSAQIIYEKLCMVITQLLG